MIFWGATIVAIAAALQIVGRAISEWRLPAIAHPRIFYDRQALRKLSARDDLATATSVRLLAEFRSPAEFSNWVDYARAVRCHAIAFLVTGDQRHAKRACLLFQHPPTPVTRADSRPATLGKALCWLAQSFDALYPELGKMRSRERSALMLAFLAHRLYRAPTDARSVLDTELWRCAGLLAAAVALAGQDVPQSWSNPQEWYRYARARLAVLAVGALDFRTRALAQVLESCRPLAEICLVLNKSTGETAIDAAARDALAIRLLGMRSRGTACVNWRTLREVPLPLPAVHLMISPRWRPYVCQAAVAASWKPRELDDAALWLAAIPPRPADTRAWAWKAGGAAGLRLFSSGDSSWIALVPLGSSGRPAARLFIGLNGCWRALELTWPALAGRHQLRFAIDETSAESCIVEAHGSAAVGRSVHTPLTAALLPRAAAAWITGARLAGELAGTPGAEAIDLACRRVSNSLCVVAALGTVRCEDAAVLTSAPGTAWRAAMAYTDKPVPLELDGARARAIILATDGRRAAAAACQRIRFRNEIQVPARPRAVCIAATD